MTNALELLKDVVGVIIEEMEDADKDTDSLEEAMEAMEEADYIILCEIIWGPDHYKSNGHTLIYPNTHVSVYDTKTGEMVRDLGTNTRELEGMTMVSNEIVYYVPLRSLIFEQLQPVLQEIGNSN